MEQASCEIEALQTVPRAIETMLVSSPDEAPTRTICRTGSDGKSSCTTITGAAPMKSIPVDMNADTRKKAEELCLYRKGWSKVSAEEYDKTHTAVLPARQATQTTNMDFAGAASSLKISAERGDALAQSDLGDAYLRGWGVEFNLDTAVYWYRKAAAQGNQNAKNMLNNLSR